MPNYRDRNNNPYNPLVLIARVCLLFSLLATFYFALKGGGDDIGGFIPWDKAVHYCCFIILTGLSVTAFPRINLFIIAIIIAALGWGIEELQGLKYFSRDKDIMDWVAEILAIITVYCAIFAGFIRSKYAQKR